MFVKIKYTIIVVYEYFWWETQMLKKTILISFIFCIYFTQIVNVMAMRSSSSSSSSSSSVSAFDPELVEFTKKETLKKWVRTNIFVDKEKLSKVQEKIAMAVPQNPISSGFVQAIKNDEGVTQYYGKTFPTIAAIELPFLLKVNEISQQKKPITLEIAASVRLVSWKVPLAFADGGTHYVNELSSEMIKNRFNMVISSFIAKLGLKDEAGEDLSLSIKTISGDCFSILEKEPNLKNAVDVIYVQNLEHFFNPNQHQEFLSLLDKLLAEDGYAYLCAQSFAFAVLENPLENPLYKLYISQKDAGDIYPGFAQFNVQLQKIKDTEYEIEEHKISDVSRPSDDAQIGCKDLAEPTYGIYAGSNPGLKSKEILQLKQRVTANAFSPNIYRMAIESHPSLEVVDAFYITKFGVRADAWSKNVAHAAAIIKKKKKSEISSSSCSTNGLNP
ncbi:MAG TPA: hypothetical protein DCZ38_02750 [Coxiellaceae bacterium]|nr:hypothetical protein [Coxiellaceae bacterium]